MSKKFYSFFILLTAFLWLGTGKMWGDEVTIGTASSTNDYVPITSTYADVVGTRVQTIYPASLLTAIADKKITGLSFHAESESIDWGSPTFAVRLGEVDETAFASNAFLAPTFTTVYSGALSITSNALDIAFSENFNYSGDKSLLIDIEILTTTGGWGFAKFQGNYASYAAFGNKVSSGGSGRASFLPMVTITYEEGAAPTCPKPTDLEYSNVTATSVDLSWTAGGTEPAWNVLYKADGDADWSAVNGVTANSYTLALSPAKNYQVKVQAACGGEDVSKFSNVVSFPTPCGAYPLPFNEEFSAALNSCWTTRSIESGTGVSEGEFGFKYNSNPPQYLITPELAATGKELDIEFQYKDRSTSYPETFAVGYSTTTNEDSEFTWLAEVTATSTSYQKYINSLPANVKYVAIKYLSSGMWYLYIDNLKISEKSSCSTPSALSKSAQTAHTATLTWTENGSATSWNVQYSTTSDFSDDNHVAVATTNSSYVLSGLEANTHYYVHVQAACEGEYSNTVDFITDCEAISSVAAWTDGGFEESTADAVPDCWIAKASDESNSYKPTMKVTTTDSNVRTGSKALLLSAYNDSGEGYAIFPAISDASLTSLQLKFWHKKQVAAFILKVGYLTDINDLSTFTELHTCANATAWTEEEVDLSTLPSGARLAFYYFGTSGTSKYYVAVDDISFATPPTCFKPLNLSAASSITPEGATFTWEASGHGEDTYQWAVATGSDAPAWVDDAAHKTSELTKAVSGLAAGSYKFYVRSYCGSSDQSDAAVSAAFTTATIPAPTIGTISATNNSANASWTAPTGISYTVQYQWSIDGSSWSEPTSALSASISPLTENTSYTFYVRSYYDASHQSENATKAFKTACDAISVTSEYTENFDGITSGIPSCWNNDEGTTTTEASKWNSAASGQSGRCVRFDSKKNAYKTNILASPLFSITSDADLTFYVKNYTGGAYEVKISVNGGARQTLFSDLTSIQNWTKKEAALSDYIGKTVQFFFCGTSNYADSDNGYIYLDEFKITPVTCRKPASRPVASGISANGATLSWGTSPAGNYQYSLVETGNSPVWEDVNTNSMEFTNLQPTTTYDFAVRSACGGEVYSDTLMVTFRTSCGVFNAPFEAGFEGLANNTVPECWDNSASTMTTASYLWQVNVKGLDGKCMRCGSMASEVKTNILVSPEIALGQGKQLLTFWCKKPEADNFVVKVTKDNGANFTQLFDLSTTVIADWTLQYVEIPAEFSEQNVKFYFCNTANGQGDYIYIDDVRVARGEVFDDAANSGVEARIDELDGQTIDFVMNRPMQFNGAYNTLCLPFDISAADLAETDHPLYDNTVKEFDYATIGANELQLAIKGASSIAAGVPCFVKFDGVAGDPRSAFLFKAVTIKKGLTPTVDGDAAYRGIYEPIAVMAEAENDPHHTIFVGADNQLYWPGVNRTMRGFRAYFYINADQLNGNPIKHGMPVRIVEHAEGTEGIDELNDNVQSIKVLENDQVVIIRNGVKYTIQGQKIQ